jgi:DNA-binding MurR/RpiR family transcriptional regulator
MPTWSKGAIRNLEETFAGIDAERAQGRGRGDLGQRQVFTLGVGVNNANARNFTYLASTGMVEFHAIPRPGSTPVDDLAWADERDVLIAMTCRPYRPRWSRPSDRPRTGRDR